MAGRVEDKNFFEVFRETIDGSGFLIRAARQNLAVEDELDRMIAELRGYVFEHLGEQTSIWEELEKHEVDINRELQTELGIKDYAFDCCADLHGGELVMSAGVVLPEKYVLLFKTKFADELGKVVWDE